MSNQFYEYGMVYPPDDVEWDEDDFIDHVEGMCGRDCYWCCNEPED